ncbi:hypothetical protein L7E55_15995 [Pelotomaculum isophthalicicum JI]|uniref:Uncharacterized protein n=1 Tax=Pelotomaculum isophthalicicum JI TaxID=947010 RepID=A0A9X4H3R4_9FIRM|nr:hypothetical protein [Pelotomaculum isophthalicicum]MDF9409831.1 hypothetical protein [Pelotomaculum isophthalicicum JI]
MKKTFLLAFIILLGVSLFGCKNVGNDTQQPQQNDVSNEAAADSIVYRNTQYDFSFSLPVTWKDYSIVTDKWEGLAIGSSEIVETGPMISIRHPQWNPENRRQDIPIMIFTLDQWSSLQQGKFHIGAAPVGPKELGRNTGYVFALPARYNFAFPPGYEEVEKIIESNPLQTNK